MAAMATGAAQMVHSKRRGEVTTHIRGGENARECVEGDRGPMVSVPWTVAALLLMLVGLASLFAVLIGPR